eukprot:5680060-Pyramimonas_sp.AAC.1
MPVFNDDHATDAFLESKRDLRRLKWHLWATPKRKACPAQSPPAELYWVILHPARDPSRRGVGFDLEDSDNSYVEAALHLAFYNLRHHQLTPKDWHIS